MTTVHTIGHSTHTLTELINLLQYNRINLVADVRTIPRSRKNPQFNLASLPTCLHKHGIGYIHLKKLGGLRHPLNDSPNKAWLNDSFRGFADYMQTPAFKEGLDELLDVCRTHRVAIMCAESLPWRCHRSLIADALIVRKIRVWHIISKKPSVHKMTDFAEIKGHSITYPLRKSA